MEATLDAMTLPSPTEASAKAGSLTIAEAAEKTQRSPSTIRRIIRSITDAPSHPDRNGVEPSPKAVEAYKKKGENFTWKIREDILLKNFPGALDGEKKISKGSTSKMEQDVLHILRHELELKNQQIEKQWEVIGALNERLREGNILMGSLQQRLALPSADSPLPVDVGSSTKVSTEAIHRASKKKVKEVKAKLSVKASTAPSRRGFFSWIRGK